ncbi:hypothetical protein C4K68_07825 [Pokkaliibacter plantistimulans]|uniref:Uncharacterized protein n=1 Tax=Proteobacteria bacterium 228 TaxID=2083153 RepID=A0A2S5KUL7_9PROT|nr:hypothetical protein [Pokkaliibacter plantistimulans]PPC77946.1 hypothetical protein C4K68_07825 [Pokkaliibacter plantistimulans]
MANIWKQFENLLENDSTLLATVLSSQASTGTSVVTLLSGDRLKVRGTATQGATVLVKGGEIIQSAPAMDQYSMVLY